MFMYTSLKKVHNRRLWRLWLKLTTINFYLDLRHFIALFSSRIRHPFDAENCCRKAGSSEANTFSACLSSAHDCPPLCPSQWPVWQMYSDYSPTHSPTVPWPLNRGGDNNWFPPLHIEVVNRWNSVFYRFEPSIHPTWLLLFGCTSFMGRVNIRLWKCQTCESIGKHDRLQVVALLLFGSTFDFVSSDTFFN